MNNYSEEHLISIIVPVYNSEKYIDRCLRSLQMQSYSNIEIIMVDDGSIDSSGIICEQYAMSDKRFKVIHKDNHGVSAARNDALRVAKGTYVAFVDSDDYVDITFIEKLYRSLIENNVELAICGLEKIGGVNISTGKLKSNYGNETILLTQSGIIDKEELWFHSIDSNLIGCYLWNKLFKKSLFHRDGLDEELLIGEDMVYLAKYLLVVNRAYYLAEPLYKYQMNELSALNTISNNEIQMRKKINSCMLSTKRLEMITADETKNIKIYVAYRRVRSSVWCIFKMILSNMKDKDIFNDLKLTIRDNLKEYRNIKCGSFIQNMAVYGMAISPQFVFCCGKIFKKLFPKTMYKLSRN